MRRASHRVAHKHRDIWIKDHLPRLNAGPGDLHSSCRIRCDADFGETSRTIDVDDHDRKRKIEVAEPSALSDGDDGSLLGIARPRHSDIGISRPTQPLIEEAPQIPA